MSEIIEEHLKDVLWLSIYSMIGIIIFNVINVMRVEFLNNIFKSIILIIEKQADLSAKYGCIFTLSMPEIPLIDYSILLDNDKYYIIINNVCIFEGNENYYHFNKVFLEAGNKYFIKASDRKVILTKK
ncbi:MAG: hypothetical protein QXR44_00935 [Thermoproteota archaeon]